MQINKTMADYKKISEYIFEHPVVDLSSQFSSASELDSFFQNLSSSVRGVWPLDFSFHGLKTKYLSARVHPETWREEAHCTVQAEIFDQHHSAIIEQDFSFGYDGNMIIDIRSVHAANSDSYPQKMRIARRLSENNFRFLLAYDRAQKPQKPSFMKIYASSEKTKQGIQTSGGYVWANNGFDFADKQELTQTRLAFKHFLARNGITLTDKKLTLFTKPCHFSAYSCGVLFSFNKHLYRAGKAFMLQHSWHGVQKTSSKNSRERRFANVYYNEPLPALRRLKAIRQLEKKYVSFLRQNVQKNRLSRLAHRYKLLRHFIINKARKYFGR